MKIILNFRVFAIEVFPQLVKLVQDFSCLVSTLSNLVSIVVKMCYLLETLTYDRIFRKKILNLIKKFIVKILFGIRNLLTEMKLYFEVITNA